MGVCEGERGALIAPRKARQLVGLAYSLSTKECVRHQSFFFVPLMR